MLRGSKRLCSNGLHKYETNAYYQDYVLLSEMGYLIHRAYNSKADYGHCLRK